MLTVVNFVAGSLLQFNDDAHFLHHSKYKAFFKLALVKG